MSCHKRSQGPWSPSHIRDSRLNYWIQIFSYSFHNLVVDRFDALSIFIISVGISIPNPFWPSHFITLCHRFPRRSNGDVKLVVSANMEHHPDHLPMHDPQAEKICPINGKNVPLNTYVRRDAGLPPVKRPRRSSSPLPYPSSSPRYRIIEAPRCTIKRWRSLPFVPFMTGLL